MLSPAHPPQTVVLVDDDDGLREALEFWLEIEGFAVRSCASGEALLDLELPEGRVCLVLDYHLGGVNGVEALEVLRARGVRYPAILITTAASPAVRARANRSAAAVIEKPLLGDALLRAIRKAI
ncbi:MAG: response regulator [Phenylobacterium sp.]